MKALYFFQSGLLSFGVLLFAAVAPIEAKAASQERVGVADPASKYDDAGFDFTEAGAFHMRAGLGATFGPESGLILLGIEGNFDRFLSVGPQFQLGLNSGETLFLATLGPRLRLPIYPSKRVELSLRAGVGGMYRETDNNLAFINYVFDGGINLDFFINRHFAVGLGSILNVTSRSVDRTMISTFGSLSFHL